MLCAVLCAATAFSYAFIFTHACHECTGGHCPICAQVNALVRNLKRIAEGVRLTAAAICAFLLVIRTVSKKRLEPSSTLVSLKIKLSD